MGMLEAPFTSSAPSATNHVAPPFRPHSLSSVERGTPVHSAQLVIPCVSCTVFCCGVCRFPAHSDLNHVAPPFRPHSLSSVERGTPVHSAQLVIPCVSCTVFCCGVCRFPAHSMKCNRVTDGKRFKSSMVRVRV